MTVSRPLPAPSHAAARDMSPSVADRPIRRGDAPVFARRREVREEAVSLGFRAEPIEMLSGKADLFRIVLNTVPARLINLEILSMISKDALLMELASAPYGFDPEEAKSLGLHVISAGGLPGRFFPETAGFAVADTVLNLIKKG